MRFAGLPLLTQRSTETALRGALCGPLALLSVEIDQRLIARVNIRL
jgi:hypothetical protein